MATLKARKHHPPWRFEPAWTAPQSRRFEPAPHRVSLPPPVAPLPWVYDGNWNAAHPAHPVVTTTRTSGAGGAATAPATSTSSGSSWLLLLAGGGVVVWLVMKHKGRADGHASTGTAH